MPNNCLAFRGHPSIAIVKVLFTMPTNLANHKSHKSIDYSFVLFFCKPNKFLNELINGIG